MDQGFEHGPARSFAPNPPSYDPDYHFQLAIDSGCNGYAAPLGSLEASADKFAGQIPLILKLNNSDTLAKMDQPISAVTASVPWFIRRARFVFTPVVSVAYQERICFTRSVAGAMGR